jgi:hypothetical protein
MKKIIFSLLNWREFKLKKEVKKEKEELKKLENLVELNKKLDENSLGIGA